MVENDIFQECLMIKKCIFKIASVIMVMVSISSCLTIPSTDELVDERIQYVPDFREFTIEFNRIGSDKNYSFWAFSPSRIGFNDEEIREAVSLSLKKMGFREILHHYDGLKDFSVQVKVLDQGVPAFGFKFTTSVRMQYIFTDLDTGEILLDKEFESEGTAELSEAFVGATRSALALGRAVKNNIYLFTQELDRSLSTYLAEKDPQDSEEKPKEIAAETQTIPSSSDSHSQQEQFFGTTYEHKTALVIGNSAYQHFPPLINPVPEANELAELLNALGFTVFEHYDLSLEEMLNAIDEFEAQLRDVRGLAFFHYGGHGVQVGSNNYLIPIDASIPDESRVRTRALNFQEVVYAMESSGSSANIMILDACRDNPLPRPTRSGVRGLIAVTSQPPNSVLVYSAEAGTMALDGVFTPILISHISSSPTVEFSTILRRVRAEVWETTDGKQRPGEYNQLMSDIYLQNIE